MHATEYPYAGLILPDARELDPRPYLQAARRVLARLDPHPKGGSRLNDAADMVRGGVFGLRVTAQEFSDYGPRMMLEVVTKDGAQTEDEAAAQILSDTVLFALEISSADIIEWYSPDVLIDAQDFIRLRSYVSPKRAKPVSAPPRDTRSDHTPAPLSLAQWDRVDNPDAVELDDLLDMPDDMFDDGPRDTLSALYDGGAAAQPVNDIVFTAPDPAARRRAGGGATVMSLAVSIFSLPTRIAMFFVSLFRSMDIRLVSQAALVTSLFAVLYNTDRLHMVLRQLLY